MKANSKFISLAVSCITCFNCFAIPIQANENNLSTIKVKLVGEEGSATISTESIQFNVQDETELDFTSNTKLKFDVHSKYGISKIKENNHVLSIKKNQQKNIEKTNYSFNYKTKDKDVNLMIYLKEYHTKAALTQIHENEDDSVDAVMGTHFICVKENYFEQANKDINEAFNLAKDNGNENDVKELVTDENGTLTSEDLSEGTYILQDTDKSMDPVQIIVTKKKDKPYIYGVMSDGRQIKSIKDGILNFVISNNKIQSGTSFIIKDGDETLKDESSFQLKMVNEDGTPVKNYKKSLLKTNKNGIVYLKENNAWQNRIKVNEDESILPVALPDGIYEIKGFKSSSKKKLKTKQFKIESKNFSGLDEDSQPILQTVLELRD